MPKLRSTLAVLALLTTTTACSTGGGPATQRDPSAATPAGPDIAITVRPASFEPVADWRLIEAPQTPAGFVYVAGDPLLTEADIVSASVVTDDLGDAALRLDFSRPGARRLYDHSSAHIDQPVAFFVDHELVSVPRVTAAMSQSAVIAGSLERFEAQRIADALMR